MIWSLPSTTLDLSPHAPGLVMGILNVTPDSFSDGGAHAGVDAALAHARQMLAEGAAIIDVGGESTRPGAAEVEINEEITDAVGEISNMVAGHVTTKIAEQDKKIKVKFVEVVMGKDQAISHVSGASHVVSIPFKTTKGKVVVEVSYTDASMDA